MEPNVRTLRGAGIAGTGAAVPEGILNNFDLEKMVDTSNEWIVERTGIRERRIARDGEVTSDLAARAARLALDDAAVSAEDVDLVIVATVTPDMPFPSCACVVQGKIGASKAAAFDIGAGCTGFVYALSLAHSLVAAGRYSNVLVIGAETLSRIVNWRDRNTCVLFGDGAGAALVRPLEHGDGVIACILGADGTRGDLLTLPGGGSAHPASHDTVDQGLHYIHMQGNQVYRFAVRTMVDATREVLDKAGLAEDDIDLVIPHQANQRLLDLAAERLGAPEKVYSNVARFGNTSAASIPIALDEASRAGRLKADDRVLLVAFGAGLTWGAAILRWCKDEFRE
ncbi:MAG: beta-ketoacyl-ACP synthase III [Bacillota bacterium]|nr:beta-ketoacyl-ACP synthase III [Bacillota bacterium]